MDDCIECKYLEMCKDEKTRKNWKEFCPWIPKPIYNPMLHKIEKNKKHIEEKIEGRK